MKGHALAGAVAAMALAALVGHPGLSQAAPRVGVAAAVRGAVTLDRSGSIGVAVDTGTPIFIGDKIQTRAGAGLQILLLDETVFTLGPNSTMLIDEFVFDPSSGQGSLDAELVRGAFRFISGRIAKSDPDSMKVRLPSGTIGIRGTMVETQVDPRVGRALVILAGPGEGNSAGAAAGHIRVDNIGVARDVLRSGWGVEIPDRGSPPSPPFPVPPELYTSFQLELDADAPRGDQPSPPGDDPQGGEQGGDAEGSNGSPSTGPAPDDAPLQIVGTSPPPVGGGDMLEGTGTGDFEQQLGEAVGDLGLLTLDPDLVDTDETSMLMEGPVTSLTDLAVLSASYEDHFFYDLLDVPLDDDPTGSVDIHIDLDFGNDQVGVQVLALESSLFGTMGFGSGSDVAPFSSGMSGLARYSFSFDYIDSLSSTCMSGTPCTANLIVEFQNTSTLTAGQVKVNAQVVDQSMSLQQGIIPQIVPVTSMGPGL